MLKLYKKYKDYLLKDYTIDVILAWLLKNNYSNRLIYFNIKSLSHRRLISDMVLTYKILNGLVDVEAISIFDTYSSQCRGPLIKLRSRKYKSKYYLNYFGNRVP